MQGTNTPSILVTGGTGSFGSAFCRFLLEENLAERICVLSRSEHAQAEMAAALKNDARMRFFIGDVRDEARLVRAMQGCHIVVHASALKRIEVGRYNPEEMVKTNIGGAINVISAARLAGVKKVVGLSTDKAFQPVSAYGTSKLMMEHLFIAANDSQGEGAPIFTLTRYGNVWGSAGSILPKWLDLIQRGEEKVPVTDPNATRFFMTMAQAIELVMGAIVHGKRGDVCVPRLPAYRVGDLAEALGVEMEVTGMGTHEKLHESMQAGHPSDAAPRMSVSELRRAVDVWKMENGLAY
jgi:UDP-N-acetylglucosamine 4,6-dehydratase/5-epimerase